MKPGDRVIWNGRTATIQYQRMAPPTYSEVAAFSILLDDRLNDPRYSGTIVSPKELEKI